MYPFICNRIKRACVSRAAVGLVLGFLGLCEAAGQPFALTDSDPDSPEFRARFLASYGVNGAIEPQLSEEDRPLYESVLPYLADSPEQAIALLEPAVSAESNAAFDFLLGNLYYATGDFETAGRWLHTATEKLPSFRRAYRTLALSLVQQGKVADAVPYWLKVITLGGGDAQSYGLLGYGYLTQEKYQSALKAYEMARMFDADSLDFKRGYAQSLLMTNQPDQASALFDELIAAHPENGDFWMLQANAYLALNQHERAIANLELVREIGEASWDSLMLLGDLYLDRGAYGLASQTYRTALGEADRVEIARAMRPLKRLLNYRLFQEADRYLESLEAAYGAELEANAYTDVAFSRAQIQLEKGEFKQATATLKKLVEMDPLQGKALLLLGDAYQRQDNPEEAIYYFERARSVDTVAADALVALGRLEVERGRYREGIEYLRKALEINPQENVRQYLERVEQIAESGRSQRRGGGPRGRG